MVTVSYCSLDHLPDHEIGRYLQLLPGHMQREVKRYRYVDDLKSSLLARLMLYESLTSEGLQHLLVNWTRDNSNKPCLAGWQPFSISHSGGMVLFSKAENVVGIDIEKKLAINYDDLLYHFHDCEQAFIAGSPEGLDAFYDIWVKKEAFLKAIGTGIIKKIDQFDCTDKSIEFEGVRWYFHPLPISCGFTSYLCSINKVEKPVLRAFHPGMLKII